MSRIIIDKAIKTALLVKGIDASPLIYFSFLSCPFRVGSVSHQKDRSTLQHSRDGFESENTFRAFIRRPPTKRVWNGTDADSAALAEGRRDRVMFSPCPNSTILTTIR